MPSWGPLSHLRTPGSLAPLPKGSRKRAAWPVIKLCSLPDPGGYLEPESQTLCTLTPLSAHRAHLAVNTSHSIKPFGDWETHCLQSQHKSAKSVLNCTTCPPGSRDRSVGLPGWLRLSPCASHSNGVIPGRCSHLIPTGSGAALKTVGRELASLSGIDFWLWGKFQEQYPRP